MKPVYLTDELLDARRFHNFLRGHQIDSTVQAGAPGQVDEPEASEPEEFSVCVDEERAEVASRLVAAFQKEIRSATDDVDDSKTESSPSDFAPDQGERRGFPSLTLAFCAACVGASFGLWTFSDDEILAALRQRGWRSALDIADGSYWGLLSSMLPHRTIGELFLSLGPILILGSGIERCWGRAVWLALTLTTALITTAGAMALTGEIDAGAAGLSCSFAGFALLASARRRVLNPVLLWGVSLVPLFVCVLYLAWALDHWLCQGSPAAPAAYGNLFGFGFGCLAAVAFVIQWKPRLTQGATIAALLAAVIPLRGSPWLTTWLLDRGEQALHQGDPVAARGWFGRAIARSRTPLAEAYLRRGSAHLMTGNADAALADFDAVLAAAPKTPYCHTYRALARMLLSNYEEALAEANREILEICASGFGFAVRGQVYFQRAHLEEAARDFERATELEPRSASNWVQLADINRELARYEAALAAANRAQRLNPDDGTAYLLRGIARAELADMAASRSDLERSLELLKKRLPLCPDDPWLRWSLAQVQLMLYDFDRLPLRLEEAQQHAERALQASPDYSGGLQISGSVLRYRREFEAAEEVLTRCLELNSRDTWALYDRGITRHALGRTESGLADLERAVLLHPRFVHGYYARGRINHELNRNDAARVDLNRALELNPRFAAGYRLRGEVHRALGDTQADLNRARELAPDDLGVVR